jgi:hypothetical protein
MSEQTKGKSKRPGKSCKSARISKRHSPVPRKTPVSPESNLTPERLERLSNRVAKFRANISAIKSTVESQRQV